MSPAGFQRTIEVVEPDPRWPAMFEREAARVREALGTVARRIDHYGSTAVPGLAAKPIIDLHVAVARLDGDELERRLSPLGYARVPWPGDAEGCPFFALPADGPRTHHLHVCVEGSPVDRRHIAVRDFLRAHPEEAAAYGRFKRDLAARCLGDRQAYVDGKDAYVKALQARALEWAAARDRS